MKISLRPGAMIGGLVLAAVVCGGVNPAFAFAGDEGPKERIEEIAFNPGHFDQMCGGRGVVLGSVSFFGFMRDDRKISAEQFLEVRKERDAVIAILRRAVAEATTATLTSGRGSFAFQSKLLMLIDLNGSEALEELIAAAGRLATRQPKPPVSENERTNSINFQLLMNEDATYSTILALLYFERDRGVLTSEFMTQWRNQVQMTLELDTSLTWGPSSRGRYSYFDPWEKQFVTYDELPRLELTEQRKQRILGLARAFVARVPVEQRARAKNMIENPTPR